MNDLYDATLSNGLRVLIWETHAAPVATFWVWYRVGSRNETTGSTGISHWVEHMLFKGTPSRPGGTLTRLVDRLGGRWNAFTWKDYTAYFEVLPAEHLETAVRLEADRMVNALFEPDVVASERTVIISEREGQENFAGYYLREEIDALAFKAHPYRHPVIGWKSDLRAITRDDLYNHYRTFYHPSNALVVAAGDIDTARTAALIGDAMGGLPAGPRVPEVRTGEPIQEGERRVVLRRPGGGAAYVGMAFHVPAASHADMPALMVLDGVLAGFSGPVPFDGGSGGRSSRLYRALVDGGLATDVGSGMAQSIDPTLFRVSATVRAGADISAVEAAILIELTRIGREPVTAQELARVKRQAQAQFVYMLDGASRRAVALGAVAVVDRPEALFALPAQIERVTAEDVTRVAHTYFGERTRTVGWYVPDDAALHGDASREVTE